jgi:pimeloyl-ACP methyl ester carboxylesterase
MPGLTQLLTLSDGRELEILTMGDPTGKTVVFQHGTPGSIYMLAGHAAAMLDRGFFCILTSRAGYGLSSRNEGRQVASVVRDLNEVLEQLDRTDYVTIGWSGGGPHALACAALDADRCRGAISVAGVAPVSEDFDWTDGMSEENNREFADFVAGGEAFEKSIIEGYEQLAGTTPENCLEVWGPWLSEVDAASLSTPDKIEDFARGTSHAFVKGYWGYYDDNVGTFGDWGFDPASIAVPVGVWYGDNDLMVPVQHGNQLVSIIPTAVQHHYPAEGHLSIFSEFRGAIADEIAAFHGLG